MAGIVGALLCWHVGATTEGALRISHSSDSTEWIAAKSAQIPTTASGGGDQPFTIECWIKMNSLPSGRTQILNQYKSGATGRVLLQVYSRKLTFIISGTTQTSKTELQAGVWTHVAATRNASGQMDVYINGVKDNGSSKTWSGTLYDGYIRIGNVSTDASPFDGDISELRVWTTARSADEISATFSRRMTGNEAGLLYCWPMDDGTGSTSCREIVSGAAAAIAVDKVTNNQVAFVDTMLPSVLFRQTLTADTSDALSILPGTLAVPDNTDVTISGGYTMDPGKNTAGVIEVGEGATLTVNGAATSASGGFVKTGAGTLCYTGTADHVISYQNRAATSVLRFDPSGAGLTNGWQSTTVAEGTIKVDQPDGGSVTIGDGATGNLVVGCAWSADGSDERAAHFILENGTVNANIAYIGYWRGTAASAPVDYPTSTLTVNGGSLLLSEGLRVGYANAVFTLNGGLVEVVPVPANSSGSITERDLRIGMAYSGRAAVAVNLNGGILRVQNMSRFRANPETVINFNGGVWQMNGCNNLVLADIASNIVCAGGAKLDASLLDGATFAVEGNFLHDSSLGDTTDGGVMLLGGSLIWRSSASTFTGPLTMKSGATLVLDTAGATVPAALVLESGATLSMSVAADGTPETLSIGGAATLNGAVELVDESSGGLLTANGDYCIMTYSGAAPDVSGLSAPYLPSGKAATFAAADGSVTMTISTLAEAVRWNVDADGYIDDPANWYGTFSDGSAVTFGDIITANRTVTVTNDNLSVDSITFDNAVASWTLAGSGLTVVGNITASNGSHVVTAPLDIPHGTIVTAENGATLSLGTVSGEGSIATVGRVSLGDTSGLSGLSVASGRLTLSAIQSDITVGYGVLHYTGPDATTTNSITLDPGTFSDNGTTKGHAAIIQTDHDLEVTGSFNCQSGAFLKRGPGKLTLTAAAGTSSYLGRKYNTPGTNKVADNDTPALAIGDAPATGHGAVAVIDGTLELTGSGTFTDSESFHVGIGSVGAGEGLKETAGTLILDGPTLTVNGQCNLGFLNGFVATADEPVHSVLHVKSGTLNLNNSSSACLNMGMGETEGMFIAPELVIDGGTVNMNNNTIAFGRASAAPAAGSRVTVTMNGGRLNHKVSDNFKFGFSNPGENHMPTILNMNGGTLNVADGEMLLGCNYSASTLNFNGGTIIAKSIRRSATAYSTANTLFWNGGTFQPNASGYKCQNIANTFISTNGCIVNVGSGIAHTIALTLKHDPGLGDVMDGGVTKKGSGTLALTNLQQTAVCTFTGPVNVNGGTLVFTPIMTNDVILANGTVFSVPLSAKIGGLSGRGTVTGNEVEIFGTIAVPTSGKLTVSPSTLKIADTATIDFGRTSANPVGSGVPVAILDVSGAGSLDIPASLATTGTGRAGEIGKAMLSVVDGILYATPVKGGTIIVFK